MKRDRDRFFRSGFFAALVVALAALALCACGVSAGTAQQPEARMTPEFFDSGVPRSESDVLARLYADAANRLREMVLKPRGMTQGSREFRQARAAQQIAQVERILQQLGRQTQIWVTRNAPRAYLDGIRRGIQQAKEAGVRDEAEHSALQGSYSLIDRQAIAVIADEISRDLNQAANSMGKTTSSLLRKTAQEGLDEHKIDTILAGGLIEGTPVQTIRALREELKRVHDGGLVRVIDKNGNPMHFEAAHYAELVVRTKTRQATVVGRHNRLKALDLDLVAIVGKVSDNFCTAFLGQVFSLSGRSTKYPAYASLPGGGPPFHPNCSKSTRPFVEALAEPDQLDAAERTPDTDKLLAIKDTSQAQRAYKDLQLRGQAEKRYADTERKLFG